MIHPDYSCYTVVGDFQGAAIWEHRVVSKDRNVAIVISYSPDAKRVTPPVFHETAPASTFDTFDDCDVVNQPCIASLGLLDIFDLGAINQDHSGETDPGVQFWTQMIRRLESYQKGRHETRQDTTQDQPSGIQDTPASSCSDPGIELEQRRAENDVSVGSGPVQQEGSIGVDGGRREEPSGTIRVIR